MKSSLPFTSVVSLHTNPMTCGVAKFSAELAKRLGVPFVGIHGGWGDHPLLSWKWSEFDSKYQGGMAYSVPLRGRFSAFWHDAGDPRITSHATHVFYADPSLGAPALWCPSLIDSRKPVKLFSFGMGHKLQAANYEQLRDALAGRAFSLRVSVGLHEGMTLAEATANIEPLKQIMGPEHVTFLGCLSDEAIVEELHKADYLVAFFERGAQVNNTTIHAALDAGLKVISNFGARFHPMMYRPLEVFQSSPFSWERLISEMKGVCDKSKSRIA
jgi:hypothetical protein